ncbi:GGDEF domain-containing protein [Rhizobium sp. CFBP 8762]|uniref:GGDEF domain-containing protein n=1 Tax=Rhizobium sp. CFBP 8762 TaxID=2775279 RepID=UPI00177DADDF|nr:GGDEF domain-containing protein [Rhizobium sp. CFBP 8762]MBD8555957.1 GGDEF domain-containing protein [Rhizobium sp. CFBP 8762]
MKFLQFWKNGSAWPTEIAEDLLADMFSPVTALAILTVSIIIVGFLGAYIQNSAVLLWLAVFNTVCCGYIMSVIQLWRRKPRLLSWQNWIRLFASSAITYASSVGILCAYGIVISPDNVDSIFLATMMVYTVGIIARGGAALNYTVLCLVAAGQPVILVLIMSEEPASKFLGLFLIAMTFTSLDTILYRRRILVEMLLSRYQSEERSRIDPLTGLRNRRGLVDAFRKLNSGGRTVAVHYLDLDHFKEANDVHGHPAGDFILGCVASRVQQLVGPHDILCRIGGDEFLLLQADPSDQATAVAFAERMIAEISRPYSYDHQDIVIGVSVGLVFATDERSDPERLIKSADDALYEAKRHQRGRVVLAGNGLPSAIQD